MGSWESVWSQCISFGEAEADQVSRWRSPHPSAQGEGSETVCIVGLEELSSTVYSSRTLSMEFLDFVHIKIKNKKKKQHLFLCVCKCGTYVVFRGQLSGISWLLPCWFWRLTLSLCVCWAILPALTDFLSYYFSHFDKGKCFEVLYLLADKKKAFSLTNSYWYYLQYRIKFWRVTIFVDFIL